MDERLRWRLAASALARVSTRSSAMLFGVSSVSKEFVLSCAQMQDKEAGYMYCLLSAVYARPRHDSPTDSRKAKSPRSPNDCLAHEANDPTHDAHGLQPIVAQLQDRKCSEQLGGGYKLAGLSTQASVEDALLPLFHTVLQTWTIT